MLVTREATFVHHRWSGSDPIKHKLWKLVAECRADSVGKARVMIFSRIGHFVASAQQCHN
jgi:hypothetical protein